MKRALVEKHTPSPRLETILMVERALRQSGSIITVAQLKRKLPRQVNHNVLLRILEYLEESGKIVFSVKGITWLQPASPELLRLIAKNARP